jgi:hypothetical protein
MTHGLQPTSPSHGPVNHSFRYTVSVGPLAGLAVCCDFLVTSVFLSISPTAEMLIKKKPKIHEETKTAKKSWVYTML